MVGRRPNGPVRTRARDKWGHASTGHRPRARASGLAVELRPARAMACMDSQSATVADGAAVSSDNYDEGKPTAESKVDAHCAPTTATLMTQHGRSVTFRRTFPTSHARSRRRSWCSRRRSTRTARSGVLEVVGKRAARQRKRDEPVPKKQRWIFFCFVVFCFTCFWSHNCKRLDRISGRYFC